MGSSEGVRPRVRHLSTSSKGELTRLANYSDLLFIGSAHLSIGLFFSLKFWLEIFVFKTVVLHGWFKIIWCRRLRIVGFCSYFSLLLMIPIDDGRLLMHIWVLPMYVSNIDSIKIKGFLMTINYWSWILKLLASFHMFLVHQSVAASWTRKADWLPP